MRQREAMDILLSLAADNALTRKDADSHELVEELKKQQEALAIVANMKRYLLPETGHTFPDGTKVMESRRLSINPVDDYLCVVLCEKSDGYVTWVLNLNDNGRCWGHYFKRSEVNKAYRDFWSR